MIKGLAITPPIVGRISIGRIVERNGPRLPEKDDQFTLTTQIQTREGWVLHPLDRELRDQAENAKLRTLPVMLLFNDPVLNFRADYTLFERTKGRPLCTGDGEQCRRSTDDGVSTLPCPSPTHCSFPSGNTCKPYGRLTVRIGDDDQLGAFIFRTTGFNSIRTLSARLQYFHAVSGELLACLPLALKLRGKSTTQSHGTPIFYVDLVVREGLTLEEAIHQARTIDSQRRDAGVDQVALDAAARNGFAQASFEENDEDVPAILEEFYSDQSGIDTVTGTDTNANRTKANLVPSDKLTLNVATPTLAQKLEHKVNPMADNAGGDDQALRQVADLR